MQEIWDLFDENRQLTGETLVRGNIVPHGRYHIVVNALFINSRGETLIQQRASVKQHKPDLWSLTGGSAIQGETSRRACVREVTEELGFVPDLRRSKLILTDVNHYHGYFRDVFLFYQDIPLESMHFQDIEVQNAMWLYPERIHSQEWLWRQLSSFSVWRRVYPILLVESLRIRIPRGVYRHYKGKCYKLLDLGLHSETEEPMVIYQALYGNHDIWVRPAQMWFQTVQTPDGPRQRFTLVEPGR